MRTFFYSMLSITAAREDCLSRGLPLQTFAPLSTVSMFFKRILIFYQSLRRSGGKKNERNEGSRHRLVHKHAGTEAIRAFFFF